MNAPTKSHIILMADDDPDDRLLAQDAVKDSGLDAEVRFVVDGVDLLNYLHRRDKFSESGAAPVPSLIILDLNMPRKDGREALKEIKSDPELRKIPVVVLTTSTAGPDVSKVYELGGNSFISKPVAYNSLVGLIKTLGDYWLKVVMLPAKA